MSKYETPRILSLNSKRGLLGLALYCVILTQTGCIFDRCSYWYIGFTPFCDSSSEIPCAQNMALQQTPTPPIPFTYLDGVAVGKQYAKNFGLEKGIRAIDPLPRQMAEAGLGEAFEMGCRDGINLYYRNQIAAQQKQMGVFNDSRHPLQNGNRPGTIQTNPFAANSPDSVIHPQTDYGTAPDSTMFVRKSELEINSVHLRHNKSFNKNLKGNLLPNHWTITDVYKIIPDRVVTTDSSQVAPAAEDLFATSQSLDVSEPQVESAPLQLGNKISSRANRLQSNAVQEEPAAADSNPPAPATLTQKTHTNFSLGDRFNQQPTPAQAVPTTLGEPAAVTPPQIILRATPNAVDSSTKQPIAPQPSTISIDITDNQDADREHKKTPARPEAMDTAAPRGTPLKPAPAVKPQKLIKLTARPALSSKTQPAAPPKAQLQVPRFVQKTVASSVLVEHLDTVAPQPGKPPNTSGKAILVATPSTPPIPTLTAQYQRLTKRPNPEPTPAQWSPLTPPRAADLLKGTPVPKAVPHLDKMLNQQPPNATEAPAPAKERR
ncbi:MAG: hypothetical protein P8J33_17015 [Pirellulaceae bacterium]|nr:hypothetical protein [Pirellulaceae bacterium]